MRRTILLADDSPTIQRLVTNTFADMDFEIVSVSNGEAAIRKFDEIYPNVVLADIFMPGKTGYEVCSYIRQGARKSDTPVILLVGAFDAFNESLALECRANDHITKPFEPQALISMVQAVLPPDEVDDAVEAAAPAPPVIVSLAAPPSMTSAPAPPRRTSAPSPPLSTSSPPSPEIESSPASPFSVSVETPPRSVSFPSPPLPVKSTAPRWRRC